MTKDNEKSEWGHRIKNLGKKAFDWIVRYPVALIAAVAVIAFASFLMATGKGDRFNLGGILGKLFGLEDKKPDRMQRANAIPEDRVDDEGNPIEKGEADKEGFVQNEVQPLDRSSNPFRDKSKVVIEDKKGKREIKLPEGVFDKDVDRVLEIEPEVYGVRVKNRPEERVTDEELDLLK